MNFTVPTVSKGFTTESSPQLDFVDIVLPRFLPCGWRYVANREVHETLPVIERDVMFTVPDVVSDPAHHGLVEGGHIRDSPSMRSEQAIDRIGVPLATGGSIYGFRSL